jgi:GNAT superfamily N-acetyltransferase
MNIVELKTKEQIESTYEVMAQHYDFSLGQYMLFMDEMMAVGDFRMIGVLNENAVCCAVLGFRIGRRLYCGKFIHVDNLIVHQDFKRHGLAEKMLDWARAEGKNLGCESLLADTYVENYPAHKLFMKNGLHIRGHHMREIL